MAITNIGTSPVVPYQAGAPQEGPAYFTFAIVLPANQISISQSKPFPIGMSQVLSVLVDNRTNTFDVTVSFAGGSNFQVGRGQSTIVPVFTPATAKTLDVNLSVVAAQATPSVVVFQAFNTREDLQLYGQHQTTIADQKTVLGSRVVNPVMFTNSRNLTQKLIPDITVINQQLALTTTYQVLTSSSIINPTRIFDIVIYSNAGQTILISTGPTDTKSYLAAFTLNGNLFVARNGWIPTQLWIRGNASFTVNAIFALVPDFSLSTFGGSLTYDGANSVFGQFSLLAGQAHASTVIPSGIAPPIFGDSWTIEGWLRYPPANFTSGIQVLGLTSGSALPTPPKALLMTLSKNGKIIITSTNWTNVVQLTITSNFFFRDSNFHHFALVADGYTTKLFVDGALDSAFNFPIYLSFTDIVVGDLLGAANLDELAFWQIPKYFNNFTYGQVGAPFSANMTGIATIWHFDNNSSDSGPGAFVYV